MSLRPFVIKGGLSTDSPGQQGAAGHFRYMGNLGPKDLVTVHAEGRTMALPEAAVHANT